MLSCTVFYCDYRFRFFSIYPNATRRFSSDTKGTTINHFKLKNIQENEYCETRKHKRPLTIFDGIEANGFAFGQDSVNVHGQRLGQS